jgi:hypothetical protein
MSIFVVLKCTYIGMIKLIIFTYYRDTIDTIDTIATDAGDG